MVEIQLVVEIIGAYRKDIGRVLSRYDVGRGDIDGAVTGGGTACPPLTQGATFKWASD